MNNIKMLFFTLFLVASTTPYARDTNNNEINNSLKSYYLNIHEEFGIKLPWNVAPVHSKFWGLLYSKDPKLSIPSKTNISDAELASDSYGILFKPNKNYLEFDPPKSDVIFKIEKRFFTGRTIDNIFKKIRVLGFTKNSLSNYQWSELNRYPYLLISKENKENNMFIFELYLFSKTSNEFIFIQENGNRNDYNFMKERIFEIIVNIKANKLGLLRNFPDEYY